MKDLLLQIACGLVSNPDAVSVDVDEPDEELSCPFVERSENEPAPTAVSLEYASEIDSFPFGYESSTLTFEFPVA